MERRMSAARDATDPRSASAAGGLHTNRSFLFLWLAYTISALGDHLSEMALLDMQGALGREDSTRINAVMLFVFFLPFFVLGPAMGWLADRLPRKGLMIGADLARATIMFCIFAAFGWLFSALEGTALEISRGADKARFSPWVYASPLLLLGVFAAMFSPSRYATLSTVVRSDQLVRANGLMNAMGPIASIASFYLGAKIVGAYGVATCFRMDGTTFLLSAACLLFIVPPARSTHRAAAAHGIRALTAGFDYCGRHRRVFELILFATLFWSAASVVRSMIPALVKALSAAGSLEQIAYYNGAIAVGMLTGAGVLSLLGETLRSDVAISWSLIGVGCAISLLMAALLFDWSFWIGGGSLFFSGMFGSGILVSVNALLQRIVPNHFRGRVFGVKDLTSMAGLLLATGLLAIPQWRDIDRYVPLLLALTAAALFGVGIWSVRIRLRRGRFHAALNFCINANVFFCRFWHRLRREGVCTIPVEGPVIVAANHYTTLDPFVLSAASPNRYIGFMIAREFAEIPIFRWLVRVIECVPVSRSGVDTASVKAALRHLAAGKVLGIFPQGGIQHPDETPRIREGIGLLALRSGATVVPAFIDGIPHTNSVIRPLLRRSRARVRFGRPLDLSAWQGRERDRAAYREVAAVIMDNVFRLAPPERRPEPQREAQVTPGM